MFLFIFPYLDIEEDWESRKFDWRSLNAIIKYWNYDFGFKSNALEFVIYC